MSKWIAEFELEDGDKMPEHMDLEYHGVKLDFHCRPLEQESSRSMEEIKEVINCDADAETKCKMISNILTAKPHYFEEPFINKPCVSSEVCEHDKQKVLDKIRAEIDKARFIDKDTRIVKNALASGLEVAMQIIDKYKAESEEEDGNDN